jgi:hypothetical protein
MIFTERFLLPADADETQREELLRQRVRERRAISGRIAVIHPGQDGWIRQRGNGGRAVFFAVIERRCAPALPQARRPSW